MKRILFVFAIALMMLPMAVFGQCGTLTVTEADNVYQTLKIGPHCWLKPNLKTNVPGSLIYYSDMYPDTNANLNTYGRLYLWETAVKTPAVADENGFVQGICPNGWHIPNEVEVVELTSNVAPAIHANTNWLIPGTNTTDYTQMPGGFYNAITNRYENLCGEAYFWSIGTDQKPVEVWSDCHCDMFLLNPGKVQNGLSVRCVYNIYKAKVSTVDASNITKNSAQLNGDVISSGYDQSFERGFQWGTEMNDLSNILVEGTNVSSEGTYNADLTDLNPGTPYYYRTYVVNDFDTAFGVVRSFVTKFDKIVSTDSANTIKATSAILYGTVLVGLENIKERGFCYGQSNDPNFNDNVFSETNFPFVSFQAEVVDLEANTPYYYKAYAITQYDDTLYGMAKEFTTLPPMSAKADSANTITNESAILYGNVMSLGGNESVNAGFKYGTSETALDSIVGKEDIGETGFYGCSIQNLEASTIYYYVAYVTTGANDTVWSDTLNFKTLTINPCPKTPTVLDVDGNVYNTIQIGKQCWMAENLRTKVEGDAGYPQVDDVVVEDSIKAGRLYSWMLATGDTSSARVPSGIQGICPDGWHIPSDAEWTALTNYVHNQSEYKCPGCAEVQDASLVCCIASSLSSKTGWADVADGCSLGNSSTNNATGFDAFPAGRLDENHNLFRIYAYFWSSTQGDNNSAFARHIFYGDSDVHEELVPKEQGLSVRCLRDPMSVTTDSANSITKESAILYGNVKNLGLNESVNAGFKYGVCKTALDSIVVRNDVESVGEYHMNITGLYPNSDYFFVAFIAHGADTVYGDTMSLTAKTAPCLGIKHENEGGVDNAIISVKDVDNNEYTVVQIGKQCWMAENLRTKVEGDNGYPQVNDVVVKDSIKAGRLYSWVVATGDTSSASVPSGIQGICPDGWHIPSDAEWDTLTHYVFYSSTPDYKCVSDCDDWRAHETTQCIGQSMALRTEAWYGKSDCMVGNICNTTPSTGFNAFPAGTFSGFYANYGLGAFYWSSTLDPEHERYAYYRSIKYDFTSVISHSDAVGPARSVRCLRDPMSVTTDSANSITKESAILYGNVKNLGEYSSVSAGFKYGVSRTAMDSIVVVESVDETGLYSCPIRNLEAATICFYRAFVAVGTDTAWGEVKNLKTLTINPCENAPTLEDVEGNVYNTIQIGEQCWMAENLRTTKKPDGTPITSVDMIWYCPNNCSLTSDTVMTYGLLYNWEATTQGVSSVSNPMVGGICPEGWHVPSDAEWTTLIQYVKEQPAYQCEDSRKIAKSLASKQGWKGNDAPCTVGNNPSENNKTGFNAFPAGFYDNNHVQYLSFDERACFWSSTVYNEGNDMYRGLRFDRDTVVRDQSRKYDGLSVRCLRNTEIPVSDMSVQTDSVNTITNASAVLYGYVANLGGNTPVKAGFKYGVNRMALDSNVVAEGIESAGEYHLNITGLHPNSEYFFVAYVAYEDEIAYGDTLRFTAATVPCVGTKQDNEGGADNAIVSVKDGDDNEYRVVKIGNQCWMAENLRTKVDGDKGYPQVNGVVVEDSIKAGRLYGWEKVTGGQSSETIPSGIQGICPEGWHVPSDTEWTVLANYVKEQVDCQCGNSNEKIARSLASETGWDVNNTPCNVGYQNGGTNVTGFNAFPAGYYANNQGKYNNFGSRVYFWSATKFDNNNALYRGIRYDKEALDSDINSIYNALSVRCVRNPEAAPVNPDFSCGTDSITDRQNNKYPTTKIGQQCWMAQNLRTTVYADSTTIGSGQATDIYNYNVNPKYSTESPMFYDPLWGGINQLKEYGYRYNYAALAKGSICPSGWHVPTDGEWFVLENYVLELDKEDSARTGFAGNQVCQLTVGGNVWQGPGNSGTPGCQNNDNQNAAHFSAYPGGWYNTSNYEKNQTDAYFWSSTSSDNNNAIVRHITYNEAGMGREVSPKGYGISVRCVMDGGPQVVVPEELSVITDSATLIDASGAILCGTLVTRKADEVGFRYVKVGTEDTITVSKNNVASGKFSIFVSSLEESTPYSFQSYAVRGSEKVFGEIKTFTTLEPVAFNCGDSVVDRQNNKYPTTKIGNQCWMAQNLRTTVYADSSAIGSGAVTDIWNGNPKSSTVSPMFYLNTDLNTNGYEYNYAAVIGGPICPSGWHVPTDGEWFVLENYVLEVNQNDSARTSAFAGNQVYKLTVGDNKWNYCSEIGTPGYNQQNDNTNNTGFSAYPTQLFNQNDYTYNTNDAYFWSSTSSDNNNAIVRHITYNNVGMGREALPKSYGISVRCVRQMPAN